LKYAAVGTRVIICNLYGQEIYSGTVTDAETKIVVRDVPDGIYLLRAYTPAKTKTIPINIIN